MPAPLRLTDVHFTYRRAAAPSLRGVNLELEPGRFTVISGRTGAGKTTCLRTFNGLIPFTLKGEMRGRVELFGEPLERRRRLDALRRVGMVFQDFEAQLFSTTVAAEVAFSLECRGMPRPEMRARVDEALARVGLHGLAGREPGSLSGGQKQRLAIACLLAARPEILAFDEPSTDLDPAGKLEVAALLAELAAEGRTVALVEHETELVARAGRVLFLRDGAVAATGGFGDFRDDSEALLTLGVRPPDLPRLWRRLGLPGAPATVDEAAAQLAANGFAADPTRAPAAPHFGGPPLFVLQNVGFAYPGGPRVLDGVNLEFRRGESTAILGPNGAGKTTLVSLLNGLRRPTGGRVLVDGVDAATLSIGELGRRIGYVFQNPDHQLFAPTVFEEVAFSLQTRGVVAAERPARVARALAAVGLDADERRDPLMMTKGERQKLALASILVAEPDALILDEPTTGLDAAEQEAMTALLRELAARGCTLIVVTHSMDAALGACQRTVLLTERGVLADGPTREIFARDELLAAAQLRAPDAARLSARLGLGGLDFATLAACLTRRPS